MAQPVSAPLRIGIVGAGTIGRVIAETLLRQGAGRTALAWICTRNIEKARARDDRWRRSRFIG